MSSVAFTIEDLKDLTRILLERPEWLSELRRILLTDELLTLPALVRELVEFQRRADERFVELAQAIEQLAMRLEESQRRADERSAEFQRQAEERFAEFQRQIDERFAEFQRRTDERFAELAQAINRLATTFEQEMAEVRGKLLEIDYRNKFGAIFGGRLRKPQLVDPADLWDMFSGRLDESEIRKVAAADLIVRGRPALSREDGELWLVIEVSSVIDRNDVARAAERAALLRKAGLLAMPVAAGRRLTQGASVLANELRVVLAKNGGLAGWDEALSQVLT